MALSENPTIGFVGTGIMGAPIAGHIMDAGYPLVVFSRTAEKAQPLVDRGATWADSPAAVVRQADVVFTMVGYPTDVEDVYLAGDGLLANARPGSWLIDLTTSSPQLAREIHDAAAVGNVHAFDCPVTGGEAGAIAGELTLIAGISEADAAPVRRILESFSSRIFFFDQPGAGQTAKLCNQVSFANAMVGMAESIALAEQAGIDVERMLEMVSGGMGSSRAISDLGPKVVDGDWAPGFFSEYLYKDLGLALVEAQDAELRLPGSEIAFALYEMVCRTGGARLGGQAIALCYQDEASGVAAGLDWGMLEPQHDEGGCCGHHHGDGECCGHHHDDDECCGHHHGDGECCGHHHH